MTLAAWLPLIRFAFIVAILLGCGTIGWRLHAAYADRAALRVQTAEVVRGNTQNGTDSVDAQAHETVREVVRWRDRIVHDQIAVAATDTSYSCALKPADMILLNHAISGDAP